MQQFLSLAIMLVTVASCGQDPQQTSAAGEVRNARPTENVKFERDVARDDDLRAAEQAIDAGHPWRATVMLTPRLADPKRRTPAALLLAARAAAAWNGWEEVDRRLSQQGWVDTTYAGEGRELLARAALERGADSLALRHAEAALASAPDAATRAIRQVYLARALDRGNYPDSAARLYAAAERRLAGVRDWLLLRAAGNQSDSAARAAAYAGVHHGVARARIPWTEAQARQRFGDAAGAAARYAALGATVQALQLRLVASPDSARREQVKRELLDYVRGHAGSTDAKVATEVLDKAFTSFTPAEELIIARSAAVSGPTSRAIIAFERALSAGLFTAGDRIAYAQVLSRAGRSRDAMAQLASVKGPLAGRAAYQRARIMLTARGSDAAQAALRAIADRFASDADAASSALYLLADLETDDGNDAAARSYYRRLYTKYPHADRAPDARFRNGLLLFVAGEEKAAAAALDSVSLEFPAADEALAARYWSGRAHAAIGQKDLARERWREIIAREPLSYYAATSARRLGQRAWAPPARRDSFPRVPAVDSAFARIHLLERLGMETEARFEYDALEDSAAVSTGRLLATAHAFLLNGQPSRAVRLGRKLLERGEKDARAYRLVYPLVDKAELTRAARANHLDPALVAGVIRQESSFYPRAVSVAGARGLMQVMPSVGEDIASSMNFPVWYSVLLFDPDVNLQLGTSHLAASMRQYDGSLPRVLAAYNAGASRVARWSTKKGTDDPEIFAERIPFAETRDYVRIVQRNALLYRDLYSW